MYAVIREVNGYFEVDRYFNRFNEAVEYMEVVGAWGRLIVPQPIAQMVEGCGVSDLDTPNFRFFDTNGNLVWYIDPVQRAKLIFEELTGMEFALEAGKDLLRAPGLGLGAS